MGYTGVTIPAVGRSNPYSTSQRMLQRSAVAAQVPPHDSFTKEFTALWMIRLARGGFRDLIGHGLDKVVPIPKELKRKAKEWAEPKVIALAEKTVSDERLFKALKNKNLKTLSRYAGDIIYRDRFFEIISHLWQGELFMATGRICLLGYTFYLAANRASKNYTQNHNYKTATLSALHEAGRWTFGSMVGEKAYKLGSKIHPGKEVWLGMVTATLGSSAFDYAWKRLGKYPGIDSKR